MADGDARRLMASGMASASAGAAQPTGGAPSGAEMRQHQMSGGSPKRWVGGRAWDSIKGKLPFSDGPDKKAKASKITPEIARATIDEAQSVAEDFLGNVGAALANETKSIVNNNSGMLGNVLRASDDNAIGQAIMAASNDNTVNQSVYNKLLGEKHRGTEADLNTAEEQACAAKALLILSDEHLGRQIAARYGGNKAPFTKDEVVAIILSENENLNPLRAFIAHQIVAQDESSRQLTMAALIVQGLVLSLGKEKAVIEGVAKKEDADKMEVKTVLEGGKPAVQGLLSLGYESATASIRGTAELINYAYGDSIGNEFEGAAIAQNSRNARVRDFTNENLGDKVKDIGEIKTNALNNKKSRNEANIKITLDQMRASLNAGKEPEVETAKQELLKVVGEYDDLISSQGLPQELSRKDVVKTSVEAIIAAAAMKKKLKEGEHVDKFTAEVEKLKIENAELGLNQLYSDAIGAYIAKNKNANDFYVKHPFIVKVFEGTEELALAALKTPAAEWFFRGWSPKQRLVGIFVSRWDKDKDSGRTVLRKAFIKRKPTASIIMGATFLAVLAGTIAGNYRGIKSDKRPQKTPETLQAAAEESTFAKVVKYPYRAPRNFFYKYWTGESMNAGATVAGAQAARAGETVKSDNQRITEAINSGATTYMNDMGAINYAELDQADKDYLYNHPKVRNALDEKVFRPAFADKNNPNAPLPKVSKEVAHKIIGAVRNNPAFEKAVDNIAMGPQFEAMAKAVAEAQKQKGATQAVSPYMPPDSGFEKLVNELRESLKPSAPPAPEKKKARRRSSSAPKPATITE